MSEEQSKGPQTLELADGQMLCSSGEQDYDLYIVHKGKLLVFVDKGTKVTPVAYIEAGEYLGELSFFDHQARSANVIALEKTTVIRIPVDELEKQFPHWLITLCQNISGRLRNADDLLQNKGIRKKNVKTVKPLELDEQVEFFNILKSYREAKGLQ